MKKRINAILVAMAVLGIATTASAVPVTGTLDLDGQVGGVTITATEIDWDPIAGGAGVFQVTTATGDFAPLIGTGGDVMDLNNVSHPTNVLLGATGDNYMTFDAAPGLVFDLRFIFPGINSAVDCANPVAASGQECSLPGTPFNLENTFIGINPVTGLPVKTSSASFQIAGQVRNALNEVSFFTGTYTTQFENVSFQDIIAAISLPGGFVHSSYSGSFIVDVVSQPPQIPEPASLLLLGTGLVGTAVRARKARRNKA